MMSQSNTSSLKGRKVILHDMCLRDGMHAKREQISVDQMVRSPPPWTRPACPIQVTHGAGLGATRCSTALPPTATRNTSPPWPRR
jgi:4-hydroxy-2-oxovalerate/4-hydroxy-2-oxohexanoate aldolase